MSAFHGFLYLLHKLGKVEVFRKLIVFPLLMGLLISRVVVNHQACQILSSELDTRCKIYGFPLPKAAKFKNLRCFG